MGARAAINLGLLALVAALAWLALRPEPATAPPGRPVSEAPPAEVSRIVIERAGQPEVRLERGAQAWRVTAPVDAPADPHRVEALLTLPAARSESGFRASGNDLGQYGLQPPRAVLHFDALALALGDSAPIGGRRYLLNAAEDQVHLVEDRWFAQVFGSAEAWVDPRLLPAGARPVRIALADAAWRREDGAWRRSPPDPSASADDAAALAEAWQRARALSVRALDPALPWRDEVLVAIEGEPQPLRFAVAEDAGAVLLARRDLALQYRFLARQGRALLGQPAPQE